MSSLEDKISTNSIWLNTTEDVSNIYIDGNWVELSTENIKILDDTHDKFDDSINILN